MYFFSIARVFTFGDGVAFISEQRTQNVLKYAAVRSAREKAFTAQKLFTQIQFNWIVLNKRCGGLGC